MSIVNDIASTYIRINKDGTMVAVAVLFDGSKISRVIQTINPETYKFKMHR